MVLLPLVKFGIQLDHPDRYCLPVGVIQVLKVIWELKQSKLSQKFMVPLKHCPTEEEKLQTLKVTSVLIN